MWSKMSNIFIGLKKTCLGVLDWGDGDDGNATGLKEGGWIELSTTVFSHIRECTALFSFSLFCIYYRLTVN